MDSLDFGPLLADPSPETVPRCPRPRCFSKLRPHVLWFDESYAEHESYQFEPVRQQAKKSGLVLFVGTSFSVGVTAEVTRLGRKHGARLFSIDPAGLPPDPQVQAVKARAEELLPWLVTRLEEQA